MSYAVKIKRKAPNLDSYLFIGMAHGLSFSDTPYIEDAFDFAFNDNNKINEIVEIAKSKGLKIDDYEIIEIPTKNN